MSSFLRANPQDYFAQRSNPVSAIPPIREFASSTNPNGGIVLPSVDSLSEGFMLMVIALAGIAFLGFLAFLHTSKEK